MSLLGAGHSARSDPTATAAGSVHVLAESSQIFNADQRRAGILADANLRIWESARYELACCFVQTESLLTAFACSLACHSAIDNYFGDLCIRVLLQHARRSRCFFEREALRAGDHHQLGLLA